MKKLLIIFLVFMLGCATTNSLKYSDVVEITSTGSGSTEKVAIDTALREAVAEVTGLYLYSATKVQNSTLISDKIAAYTPGVVTDYTVISTNRTEDLVTVTVKSLIRKEVIREKIEHISDDEMKPVKMKLAEIKEIEDIQLKIKEGKNLMDTLLGSPDDFFDRAYSARIVGYKVTNVSLNEVKGEYLVELH